MSALPHTSFCSRPKRSMPVLITGLSGFVSAPASAFETENFATSLSYRASRRLGMSSARGLDRKSALLNQ